MRDALSKVASFVKERDGINDKAKLCNEVIESFGLTRDRSVYYCDEFAIRFSAAKKPTFSNTVLSLSNLQKFDDRPFVVCVVTPSENHLLLANTSLLRKISHSSQSLREDNIRGSFNGSDIARELDGIENVASNLFKLFCIHASIGFSGNLARLVEATNDISPTGKKFDVNEAARKNVVASPERALGFLQSNDFATLKAELDAKVTQFKNEILLASMIENVNVRGRVIEYLIAGEDDELRSNLVAALKASEGGLPKFKTDNSLGDYERIFDDFDTATDVKTKIMVLSSNPKAYNIDKMLEFLAKPKSVSLFYFVGIDEKTVLHPVLVSIFQKELLGATVTLRHWAGRNSRGVTQFDGSVVGNIIKNYRPSIEVESATEFLEALIGL